MEWSLRDLACSLLFLLIQFGDKADLARVVIGKEHGTAVMACHQQTIVSHPGTTQEWQVRRLDE